MLNLCLHCRHKGIDVKFSLMTRVPSEIRIVYHARYGGVKMLNLGRWDPKEIGVYARIGDERESHRVAVTRGRRVVGFCYVLTLGGLPGARAPPVGGE